MSEQSHLVELFKGGLGMFWVGVAVQTGDNEEAVCFYSTAYMGRQCSVGLGEDSAMGRQGSDYVFREPTGRYGG